MAHYLSSDILNAQFGPTSIRIIFQDEEERVIQTLAADGRVLELSYVQFHASGVHQFPETTKRIRSGASMGAAFSTAGISFTRQTRCVVKIPSTDTIRQLFKDDSNMWCVLVDIVVGDKQIPYASIVEFYNPIVLWPQQPTRPTLQQQQYIQNTIKTLELRLLP